MKRLLSLLLPFCLTVSASDELNMQQMPFDEIDFSDKALIVHDQVSDQLIYRTDKGFFVQSGEDVIKVKPHDIDKSIRSLSVKSLASFVAAGNSIRAHKFDNGEFSLAPYGKIHGGGPGGATAGFYIGKFATYFVCHGAIQVAALCTGPAYLVTLASLEGTFLPTIELASNTVALGTGMIGAVMTGPV